MSKKNSKIKYDENIRPVLEDNNVKSASRLLKTLNDELKTARLKVAKAVFKYENGTVDEKFVQSALGFEDYLQNMIVLVEEHIEFLENSENVILDSNDIMELRKKFNMEDEDK